MSLVVGTGVALLSAWILRRLDLRHSPANTSPSFDEVTYEISILFIGAYASYLVAEAAGLSGIMSMFFAGIVRKNDQWMRLGRNGPREGRGRRHVSLSIPSSPPTQDDVLCPVTHAGGAPWLPGGRVGGGRRFPAQVHAHYALYNISEHAQIGARKSIESLAFLSETFVFAFLGIQVRPCVGEDSG